MNTLNKTEEEKISDAEILTLVANAVKAGKLSWLGFDLDSDGFYTIPTLSQSHYQLVRAAIAHANTQHSKILEDYNRIARVAEKHAEEIAELIEEYQLVSHSHPKQMDSREAATECIQKILAHANTHNELLTAQLSEANAFIAMLKTALKFYADKNHFVMFISDAWDTCSGEPENFYFDESDTAQVEDGSVAKQALSNPQVAAADAFMAEHDATVLENLLRNFEGISSLDYAIQVLSQEIQQLRASANKITRG